jgi:putative transposase
LIARSSHLIDVNKIGKLGLVPIESFFEDINDDEYSGRTLVQQPGRRWMQQIARDLANVDDGWLNGYRYLLHDRDPPFTEPFTALLKSSDVSTVTLPARSQNLNTYAERFVRSTTSECLAKIIPFGERHLRMAVTEYTQHYHLERNHQGLGKKFINGSIDRSAGVDRDVLCNESWGGIRKYYVRKAA